MTKFKITFGERQLDTLNIEANSLQDAQNKAKKMEIEVYEVWQENSDCRGSYDLVWSINELFKNI